MKNEVDDFLAGLDNSPKEDPFKPEGEDPFKIESKEKTEEGESKEDKPLPFNKDPKVLKFIEKEIGKRMAEIKPVAAAPSNESRQDSDDISEVLSRIIGNDTPEKVAAAKDFRKALSALEEKGAQKALRQFQESAEEEKRKEDESKEELRSGLEGIEEQFGVDLTSNVPAARKSRIEFMEYVTKIAPKDADGEIIAFPDLPAAFEEFQEKSKRSGGSSSRAKDLSARSMSRSSDASAAPKPVDNSWKAVDRIFDKIR